MMEYKMVLTDVARDLLIDGKLKLENVRKRFFKNSIKADIVIDSITVEPIPTGFHVKYCQKGKSIFEINTHGLDEGSTLILTGFKAFINISIGDT